MARGLSVAGRLQIILASVAVELWRISLVALRRVGLSSMTRDGTHGVVSCIARQILYHWATREVPAIKPFRTTPNPLLVTPKELINGGDCLPFT